MEFPSGLLVRGRGLRHPLPDGPAPSFALYLLGKQPPPTSWEARWLRWPDFWLPSDRKEARKLLEEARTRAAVVACVRQRYHPRAVETPWQRRFVLRFGSDA
ncbi:MAG: protein phosphatase [Acidimicrobiales bacterium]|nr:MAG: protein phosphatase [Acidimicrobiales bacterium]